MLRCQRPSPGSSPSAYRKSVGGTFDVTAVAGSGTADFAHRGWLDVRQPACPLGLRDTCYNDRQRVPHAATCDSGGWQPHSREWQLTRLARGRSDPQAWLTSHALIARLGEDALRFLE